MSDPESERKKSLAHRDSNPSPLIQRLGCIMKACYTAFDILNNNHIIIIYFILRLTNEEKQGSQSAVASKLPIIHLHLQALSWAKFDPTNIRVLNRNFYIEVISAMKITSLDICKIRRSSVANQIGNCLHQSEFLIVKLQLNCRYEFRVRSLSI